MFKKRARPQNTRERSDSPLVAKATADADNAPGDDEETPSGTLQELLLIRKYGKQQAGIDLLKLNQGEQKKKKKKKEVEGEGEGDGEGEGGEDDYGLQVKGSAKVVDEEDDDQEGEEAKIRKLIGSNNFTQQTNALDVDKHMMAYIEAELAKRRGVDPSKDDSSKEADYDPQEELFRIAERYRIEKKMEVEEEEGNVTTSMGMLTSIPEVDLGMDVRLKNIEETEKAKRIMMEAKKASAGKKKKEEDEHFAAARFYRPNYKIQSDADALEDARREAMDLPPLDRSNQRERLETATDEQVFERFKKRIRKN